jgi:hypothetical protein
MIFSTILNDWFFERNKRIKSWLPFLIFVNASLNNIRVSIDGFNGLIFSGMNKWSSYVIIYNVLYSFALINLSDK